MLCGRRAGNGVVIHVDHIKPRSLYPELALEFSNLQVLCMDCNQGKSNRDFTDWRELPETLEPDSESHMKAIRG
jgi:5-methylcytosine-specific restriction endonuclease McrA